MKSLLMMCVLILGLNAQPTLSVSGPNAVRPGNTITLTVASGGTGTDTGVASLQYAVTLPTGYSVTSTNGTTGSILTTDSKSLSCNMTNIFCVIWGLNNNNLGFGQLSTFTVQIPSTATPGSVSFPLSDVVAVSSGTATPPVSAVTVTVEPAFTTTVYALADINEDGVVNATDVQLMLNEILASFTTPTSCVNDQNGDGVCNVEDLALVIQADLTGVQ